jgi:hypothetical protein
MGIQWLLMNRYSFLGILLAMIPGSIWAQVYLPHNAAHKPQHVLAKTTSKEQLVSLLELDYNETQGRYDTAQQTLFDYNQIDSISKEHVQNYNLGIFQDSALISLSYDAKGHQTVWLYQRVFPDNGSIVNSEKDSSSYDSHGNLVYSDKSYWNGSEWTIFYGEQTAYTYDNNGHVTSQELQLLNPGSNWMKQYKAIYKMDANGNIIAVHEYLADIYGNYAIEDSLIDVRFYQNDVTRPIQETYLQDSSGKWVVRSRYTASYNSQGQITRAKEEFLTNNKWELNETWTWQYDSHYLNTYYADSVMSAGQMQVYQANSNNFTYDADGNLLTYESLSYNPSSNTWAKQTKLIYNYQSKTELPEAPAFAENITVYPNPAIDQLHIKMPNGSGDVQINMIDMQGRIINSMREPYTDNISIPLGDIPNGLYVLQVQTNVKTFSATIKKG